MLAELIPAGLFGLFLVFARVGAALMVLPGFSHTSVSPRLRLVFAIAVSLVVAPAVAGTLPSLPPHPATMALLLGGELLVGAFIGLIVRLLMAALQVGGMVLAFQTSLANALTPDPVGAEQAALAGGFLSLVGLVLIFVTDLHHVMLRGLVGSYDVFQPGRLPPAGDLSQTIVQVTSESFLLAIQIAAPFVAMGFLFSVGVGLLARLMPQVQVFFIAMPLQIMLGFLVLALALSAVMVLFLGRMEDLLSFFLPA